MQIFLRQDGFMKAIGDVRKASNYSSIHAKLLFELNKI